MLTGQIVVVTKHPGWYGRLVQIFTRSRAYHCGPAINETQIVSAETPRVVIRDISDYTGVYVTSEELTPEQVAAAVEYALAQVDKPYAYFDIVLLVISTWLGKHTPPWIADRVLDDRQWFCSELCDAVMDAADNPMFPGRHAWMVTPKDFLTAIRERNPVR